MRSRLRTPAAKEASDVRTPISWRPAWSVGRSTWTLGSALVTFRVSQAMITEMYRRNRGSVAFWEFHYVTLRYATETLFRQCFADVAVHLHHRTRSSLRPNLLSPAMMLTGMMLEAIAKAVLIGKSGPTILKTHGNHKLRKLVKSTGLALNANEEHTLDVLTHFVRWAGRYPAPWKAEEMTVTDAQGNRNFVGGVMLGSDLVVARRISDRLELLLPVRPRIRIGTRLPSGHASADPRHTQRRKARRAT